MSDKHGAGKGDKYRPVNQKKMGRRLGSGLRKKETKTKFKVKEKGD